MAASGNGVLLRLWESLAFETIVRVRIGRMYPLRSIAL